VFGQIEVIRIGVLHNVFCFFARIDLCSNMTNMGRFLFLFVQSNRLGSGNLGS